MVLSIGPNRIPMTKSNAWALTAMERIAETTAKIPAVFMVIDPLELEDTVKITVPHAPNVLL